MLKKILLNSILVNCSAFILIMPSYSGSITGTITYEGKIPKFKEIKMDADPICVTHHSEPVFPQTLVLGEGQVMSNVFVQITTGIPKKDYPVPSEPVILTQKGCNYDPHVLGVQVGQPVKILNPDGTLHNVHALSKVNPEFNLAMPKFRKEMTKVFKKEESIFPIKCDVHPWMSGWLAVLSHPYFQVTKVDGQYTIDNLPPGDYTIEAWHEKLGKQKARVKIEGGEAKEINFTFSRPDKPKE